MLRRTVLDLQSRQPGARILPVAQVERLPERRMLCHVMPLLRTLQPLSWVLSSSHHHQVTTTTFMQLVSACMSLSPGAGGPGAERTVQTFETTAARALSSSDRCLNTCRSAVMGKNPPPRARAQTSESQGGSMIQEQYSNGDKPM